MICSVFAVYLLCVYVVVILCSAFFSTIMAAQLNDLARYAIERINSKVHSMTLDIVPFDEYMECVAKSQVFKKLTNSSTILDCDGYVDQFLLENTEDSPQSSKAFDVSNEIVFQTLKLYKWSETDIFSNIRYKHKRIASNLPNDLEPTEGLHTVVGMCTAVIIKYNKYCFSNDLF